jgi:hypothetical protein
MAKKKQKLNSIPIIVFSVFILFSFGFGLLYFKPWRKENDDQTDGDYDSTNETTTDSPMEVIDENIISDSLPYLTPNPAPEVILIQQSTNSFSQNPLKNGNETNSTKYDLICPNDSYVRQIGGKVDGYSTGGNIYYSINQLNVECTDGSIFKTPDEFTKPSNLDFNKLDLDGWVSTNSVYKNMYTRNSKLPVYGISTLKANSQNDFIRLGESLNNSNGVVTLNCSNKIKGFKAGFNNGILNFIEQICLTNPQDSTSSPNSTFTPSSTMTTTPRPFNFLNTLSGLIGFSDTLRSPETPLNTVRCPNNSYITRIYGNSKKLNSDDNIPNISRLGFDCSDGITRVNKPDNYSSGLFDQTFDQTSPNGWKSITGKAGNINSSSVKGVSGLSGKDMTNTQLFSIRDLSSPTTTLSCTASPSSRIMGLTFTTNNSSNLINSIKVDCGDYI